MEILPEMFIREKEDQPKVSYNDFSDEDIPIISLASDNKSHVLEVVRKACSEWGAFQIIDHGIPQPLIRTLMSLSSDFFALPNHEKLTYSIPGPTSFRVGSFYPGQKTEFRQRFTYQTYPLSVRDYSAWPQVPQGWRECTQDFSEQVKLVSLEVLGLISESMGFGNKFLESACHGDLHQTLVMNFYPKCPQPEMVLGVRAHTDPSALTLLIQYMVGGLQITKDEGNTWITVKPVDGALVVFVGEYLHILSNGLLRKALHRGVVNDKENRSSIGAFHRPLPEAQVYPHPEMVMRSGGSAIVEEAMLFSKWYSLRLGNANTENDKCKAEEVLNAITKCSSAI